MVTNEGDVLARQDTVWLNTCEKRGHKIVVAEGTSPVLTGCAMSIYSDIRCQIKRLGAGWFGGNAGDDLLCCTTIRNYTWIGSEVDLVITGSCIETLTTDV
jgi:hypothetical protein